MKTLLATVMFVTLTAMMVAVPLYAEYQDASPEQRVFEGKVGAVDTGKLVLTVNGAVKIDFPISSDTVFKKYGSDMETSDISFSDINVGDYVTVEYYRTGPDESRVPDKVTKVTVEYDKSGW